MFSKETYQAVLDGFDGIAYLADTETYELIYINKKLASYLNIKSISEYAHKKCYEVLQGEKAPCSFCSNKLFSEKEIYSWERFHPQLKKFFELKDTIIEIDGKKIRLEFGHDVTHIKSYVDTMEKNISREQLLVNCAKTLCIEENLDFTVSAILEEVTLFFNADRAYIFEKENDIDKLNATHVYVMPQAKSFRNILSNVINDELQQWIQTFCNKNEVSLQLIQTDFNNFPELRNAFIEREIKNLLLYPITHKNTFLGLIGIDNARINIIDKEILATIALFVINNIQKRKHIEKLTYLSEIDELTGVYNRNKFNTVVHEIRKNQIHFGIIYIDVNGLKKINDTEGHDKGDELLQNICHFLKKHFSNQIYRIGGDEFVVLMQNIDRTHFEKSLALFHEDLTQQKEISLSIGEYYCTEKFIDYALQRADQIMFERKRQFYKKQK